MLEGSMRSLMPRLPRLGLRTRLSIGMVASILLITLGVTTTAIYFVKRHMQAAIANEEFERISAIAEAVDQKFLSRRTLLKTFGDSVEAHRPANTALLQDFLVQHTSLKDAFANVAVIGLNGDLVAGLNALGVTPRDMIAILQSIKAAGALQADIEVM